MGILQTPSLGCLNELFQEQAIRKIEMLRVNEISLSLTKNPECPNRTKYIDDINNYLQELVDDREIMIE